MQTIDVTGLLPEQVRTIESLVNGYRQQATAVPPSPPPGETPEEWVRRFEAWAASHTPLGVEIDDDRETIYGGRGE